jgi:hypothetical protein
MQDDADVFQQRIELSVHFVEFPVLAPVKSDLFRVAQQVTVACPVLAL